MLPRHLRYLALAAASTALSTPVLAQESPDVWVLVERLEKLEQANAELSAEVDSLRAERTAPAPVRAMAPPPPPPPPAVRAHMAYDDGAMDSGEGVAGNLVGISPEYGYTMLDHAENVNNRTLVLLKARQSGQIRNMVTLSGAATIIANAHFSNRAGKFGYLMRHPTPANQIGKRTQEVTINSAQLAFTVAPTKSLTAYVEMLYDPEQSFGSGTLTALARNQVQVRKAFVMFGNLDKMPVYVAAGKMDVPFGLQDTVSPFTNSTNWHAFAPLAYGGQIGYYGNGLHVRAMAVQGGAQFRAANTPVGGTTVPSKLNNFAVDANYTYDFTDSINAMLGGSYIHGSAYCQGYPIFHFTACADNVPAWAAYGKVNLGRLMLLGEFARTTKIWPGTQVPNPANPLSQFEAAKVTSFTVGGRYRLPVSVLPTNLSVEFSQFRAGPDGSPWERQNQWVAGLSHRVSKSVDLFGELIRTEGFAPLNFLSGGNFPDGSTWSDADARSHVVMMGVQAAF